jgi:predicted DNA-binding protein
MQVNLNPELAARLRQWTEATGRSPDELVVDAMAGYLDELSRTRQLLDNRYEGIRNGEVQLMDGEDALKKLKDRTQSHRPRG